MDRMPRTIAALALSALAPLAACKDSSPPPVAPSAAETGTVTGATAPAPPPAATPAPAAPTASVDTSTPTTAPTPPAPASSGDFFACATDADCISVPKNECCDNGHLEAVNKGKKDAYKASFTCPNPKGMCPHYKVNDTRVPACDATKKCVMTDKK